MMNDLLVREREQISNLVAEKWKLKGDVMKCVERKNSKKKSPFGKPWTTDILRA